MQIESFSKQLKALLPNRPCSTSNLLLHGKVGNIHILVSTYDEQMLSLLSCQNRCGQI